LENKERFYEGFEKLGRFGAIFFAKGYFPKRYSDKIKEAFSSLPVVIEIEEPYDAPTKLSNPYYVRDFEEITKMYSLPRYKEVDPTPFISIFYPMFVGLTFADVGYSLILLPFGFLARKLGNNLKNNSIIKWGNIIIYSAIWGVIWGILFNSFFAYPFLPITILRLSKPLVLLGLPIILGTIHVSVAALHKIINGIRFSKEDLKEAVLFYIPTIPAMFYILMKMLANIELPIYLVYPIGIAIIYKLITEKIQFYGSFFEMFGKILSYLRLTALALATDVMEIALFAIVNVLPFAFIGKVFVILFNFILSVLSGFIHPLRLHFVEAFQVFYYGGGKEYIIYGPTKKWLKD